MRVLVFTNMYPFPAMPFYGSFVKDEVDAVRKAGIDVEVYFVNGKDSKSNYIWAPFGLMRRLRARTYDVIHVHHSFCAFFATLQKSIPVVWTFHEGEITSEADIVRADPAIKRLAYSKGFKRSMARRVDAVAVVSSHLIEPLGITDATTIPCGIDIGLFRPMDKTEAKERLGLDPAGKYVLFPSAPDRLEKRFELAEAGVMAYNRRSGRSGRSPSSLQLIGLDNVPHDEVPLRMNACELLLMTSAFEASPVTIREALACNVPVISTDVGDVKAVIDDIDGCYIIDSDAGDIAEKIDEALSRPTPFTGRDNIAGYSLDVTSSKLVALYERVTEQNRRG
jgi:glycosyltransferase involved in cell wall biosynthesis